MGQIARYNEAPYNGVSQAPPQVRPDNMAEAVEDTFLSLPQGATKRPPYSWMARLGGHPGLTSGLFEVIEREGSADAFLTVTSEAGVTVPRLYLAAGLPRGYEPGGYAPEAITIQPAAQAYLNLGNPDPSKDIVVVTVEDYTFLLNRKAIVAKRVTTAPARPKEAIVWVRQAAYARVFSVTVSPAGGTPVTVSLRTPNGTSPSDAKFVDTEVIATALLSGAGYTTANEGSLTGNLAALVSQGFTVTRVGPVLYISSPLDFTVDVADGQGGTAMLALKDKAQRFADLPQKAVDGFTVRISQQSGSEEDDFFVRYRAAAGQGSGIWEETIGPGAELGLDPATMPVGLFFDVDNTWKLQVLGWKPRAVGDQVLSPDPDFVGQTIRDLTFWRGRIALISAQSVKLSSADDPLRLYPTTLSTVTDADPIELVSPLPGKGTFSRALSFDSRLVVFADQGQAAVQAQGVLTPATASIDVAGAYEYSGPLRPLEVGERMYFLAPRSDQASVVYELEGGQDSEGKYRLSGDDLTAATPRYVPAGVDRSAASAVNYLVTYARSGSHLIYAHLFRYANREKVQNAWSRWWLPEGWAVGGLLFRNTQLYILACKGGEAHVVMADIAPGQLDPGSSRLLTHLNYRLLPTQVQKTYANGVTTLALPYSVSTGKAQVTVLAPGLSDADGVIFPEGYPVEVASQSGKTVTLAGDWSNVPLWVGFQYAQVITLSTFYALGSDNRPLLSGRLSVRRVAVDLSKTGYLRAEVSIGARSTRVTEFTGYSLDSPDSLFNQPPEVTDSFSFGVGGKNTSTRITLVNDTHLPSTMVGLEWRGELNLKASR